MYAQQPPAWFHTRILVGPGEYLRAGFVDQHRITHVINCAFDVDSPAWFRRMYPTKYVSLSAYDGIQYNILSWFPAFENAMKTFLRDGNGTVYVHCQAGINRSAFLALAYVAKNFHIDLHALIDSTKRQRPCMFTNPAFRIQVEEFINGCVSSEKNTRLDIDDDRRNLGLGSPRNRPNSEGFQEHARHSED